MSSIYITNRLNNQDYESRNVEVPATRFQCKSDTKFVTQLEISIEV